MLARITSCERLVLMSVREVFETQQWTGLNESSQALTQVDGSPPDLSRHAFVVLIETPGGISCGRVVRSRAMEIKI